MQSTLNQTLYLMRIHQLIPPRILGSLLVLFAATAFTASCSSSSSMNPGKSKKVIEMTKGPCYGNCPVFTLTIYENGYATYRGERYTDRLGTYGKKLDKAQMQRLLDEFKKTNLWQYRDVYVGRIPDMQSVTITYHEGARKKTVAGKEIRPNSVKWLESVLDQVANTDGWVLKEALDNSKPDFIIPNELLVELYEGVEPEEWAKEYSDVDMLFDQQLGESEFWVFSFDDALIEPEQMLERVRLDEDVISAEFNKKLFDNLDKKAADNGKPSTSRERKLDKQQ